MIGLITADLGRSLEFYRHLGLEFKGAEGSTHQEAEVPALTFFLDGRPTAWHPGFEGRTYPWLLEFYFDSFADLRQQLDELGEAGYEVVDEPYDTGFGMWFAFVTDPDGNTVLLSAERSGDEGA